MKHSIVVACALTLAIACGDSKPDPKTPPVASADNEPDAPPPPTTPASAAPAETTSTPPPAPDAGPPEKPGVVVGETKDECTPVGVEFEKRARPKLKDCYAEGKKKDANLQGTVKIKVTVDLKGKIKSTKITEKTLPGPVAECMLKVIKATPFPEVDKCWDSTILLPITFPTPR